jgi:pimeloyl-ACP methyl ester carboxylesterase
LSGGTLTAGAFATTIAAAGVAFGGYAWNNVTSAHRSAARVMAAGVVSKHVTLSSGTTLSYSEGPPAGPALVLIHGQASARHTFDRVFPALSVNFHVFAVDVAGHGASDRTPGRYDVHTIGADLVEFLRVTVGEPAIVSGHSSGGLLAAWMAAEAPDAVSAVLLEDPPLFTTEPARYLRQFNYVDLARPAHDFLQQVAESDFASWYMSHNAWIRYFGGGRDGIIRYAQKQRRRHPEKALTLWFFPPVINETFAHMHTFDPEFAESFYRHDWQAGFDQSRVLAAITQPTTLVHTNWRVTDEDILEGAMTDDDAARARELLTDCRYERVNTGHGFHFENPTAFVTLLNQLSARAARADALG